MSAAGRRPRSLTTRIAWLTSAWLLLASLVTASIVIAVYREATNRDFNAVLSAHLGTLLAGTRPDGAGRFETPRSIEVGEARFAQPESGWYWAVEGIGPGDWGRHRLTSSSLGETALPVPADAPDFSGIDYRRSYTMEGPAGFDLRALETEVELTADGRAARFRVFGNQSETDARVDRFARTLAIALAAFAIGTVVLGVLIVRVGLRPLREARAALAEVREGRAETLDVEAPREIAPLVEEVNALIAGNRRIVERARTQVGNLAHGLKTPLAVIINESRELPGERGATFLEQAQRMRGQIETYLDRARTAAGARGRLSNTDAVAVVERVVSAIRKLRPDRRIEFEAPGRVRFDGEEHDLEEVAGNLVENAAKWARRTIWVSLATEARSIVLTVQDDGPGMDPDAAASATRRGVRLDESVEGSGLGLSIVRDIASEYDGAFELGRSEAGGLLASVRLPRRV